MTTKERILAVLEQLPERELPKVLTFLEELHPETKLSTPSQAEIDAEFLSTYDSIAEKRKEVFQRLADS